MNASTFYGLRKAQEKTTACDIPSRSEDSDLSDSDDDYPPGEMEKFVGSLLWMSLIRLPSSRMYWNPKFYRVNSTVSKRGEIKGNATLFSPKAKQACGAKYGNLDDTLLTWFKQACAAGINFDGSILHEKAMEIANRLGITDFTVSNGWIDHFRKRHGIAYKTVSGEAASVNMETANDWKSTLSTVIEGYKPCDIYNADEMGLFFRVQPSKSSSLKGEACHGGKCSNDRLTVLLYYNVDKLKPWVIGKYRNPRYFKNTRLLPCHYSSNCRAWMTCALFEEFLRYFYNKTGSQCRSVLLFLDNCDAHQRDLPFLQNVKIVFFPPNTPSHLQP
ncbi:tigger transposable element-derived protein 6 [Rhipicephalus sanguineus]|uniref:tigger transposable element-derived protein 6 n=1 Tax=Rhipicephalus sanguineus TaxID=34632 RepID=UPI0018942F77|nr:tigger transposable element-derived protein 6 [Rhipicephalus sanguineus]